MTDDLAERELTRIEHRAMNTPKRRLDYGLFSRRPAGRIIDFVAHAAEDVSQLLG